MKTRSTRRHFLICGTTSVLGFFLSTRHGFATAAAANERLNLALVGVGGRGEWFVGALPGMQTRFAALCDTHAYRLNRAGEKFPEAKRCRDFRRMLDETADRLDGVVVATPDHSHAVISARALRARKPVFCEKPLTRTIREARALRELAASTKLATHRTAEVQSHHGRGNRHFAPHRVLASLGKVHKGCRVKRLLKRSGRRRIP
ncbi:MAG TPA: Gfo/Idh/MocA family oxidoreductase [Verrucomicrobiota bacterium]|nr:Gfo/Idh/MocA family oxidoreductase [Verrucomicrobiota bacterium]HNU50672.1 Gfo/Idh/MocA family oxidoreductase [Verrucomicrobiota bacterium]